MLITITMLLFGLFPSTSAAETAVQTVAAVDLQRYAGTWYEIGRYPNRFQRKCASDVRAEYTLRADGKVEVVNRCRRADGSMTTARGTAKVVDRTSNAKLKVTFFWPFSGDYWIIGLDPDYQWAVVGHPQRKYLWILSRTPALSASQEASVSTLIRAAGYDLERIQRTQHPTAAGR